MRIDPRILIVRTSDLLLLSSDSMTVRVRLRGKSHVPELACFMPTLEELTTEDVGILTEKILSLGWTADSENAIEVPMNTQSLGAAIGVLRTNGPLADSVLVGTEVLKFGRGVDRRLRIATVRRFVSRLDWRRLCAYAPLTWRNRQEYAVFGDLWPPSLAGLANVRPPDETEVLVAKWDGSAWRVAGGESWLPSHLRSSCARLDVSEILELEEVGRYPHAVRSTWLATGVFAHPNLAFVPEPAARKAEDRWCMGTGETPELAVAKARSEGIERYVLGTYSAKDLTRASLSELGTTAVDPSPMLGYSARQREVFHLGQFDPDAPDWWVSGECGDGSSRWLPASLVFSPFGDLPMWLHPGFPSSNGSAAHPDRRESQLRAWMELNERDAFLRMFLSRTPPSVVDNRCLDPDILEGLSDLGGREPGDQAILLELRSSLGVFAYGCIALQAGRLVVGASAQEDPLGAMRKAISEAGMQLRYPLSSGTIRPEEVRTPADHSRLYNADEGVSRASWMLNPGMTVVPRKNADLDGLLSGASFYTTRESGLFVSRCLDLRLIPMAFGYDTLPEDNPLLVQIRNYAFDSFPHPFA